MKEQTTFPVKQDKTHYNIMKIEPFQRIKILDLIFHFGSNLKFQKKTIYFKFQVFLALQIFNFQTII